MASLLTVHSTVHSSNNGPAAKTEKVKLPSISAAGTSEEWSYFLSRWSEYVRATRIDGRNKVVQLLECCDEPLRKTSHDLPEVVLQIKLRKQYLQPSKNTMIARVTLHNMRQDRDEPVRNFSAKLRGQAGVCKFVITCPNCNHEVNYTDTIVRDVLARGIADPDIQLDLLGDKNQNMTLEEVTQFVEAKEAGKRSASRLLDTHSIAATSSYKKTKQPKDMLLLRKERPRQTCTSSYPQNRMSCLRSQVWTLQQGPSLRDRLSKQRQGETPYSFYRYS